MSPIPDEPRGQVGYAFGAGTLIITDCDGDQWDLELTDHTHVLVVSYDHTTVLEVRDPEDSDSLAVAVFDVVSFTFEPERESISDIVNRAFESLFTPYTVDKPTTPTSTTP